VTPLSREGGSPDVLVPRLAALAHDGVPRHVVICLFNGMGDAFLALPVIRFAIATFGREHVTVWAHDYRRRTVYAELGDIVVGSAESNRNSAAERKDEEVAALRRRLPRDRGLSWVSLNPYEPRTVVEDHAISILRPQSVWVFRGAHLRVDHLTGTVLHRMDQYFRVIGERRTPAVDRYPVVKPTARQRAAAIRAHVHQHSKRLIAVHAQTKSYKCWPEAHWQELARLLRSDCELVLLGLAGQAIAQDASYLSAPPDWEKQTAILACADAFVGIDSCFSHVADACNLPGVVLYADVDAAAQWRPKGPALGALIAQSGDIASLAPAAVADRLRYCLENECEGRAPLARA
jgi:hypothetical protein